MAWMLPMPLRCELPLVAGVAGLAGALAADGRLARAEVTLQVGAVAVALLAVLRCVQRGRRYDDRGAVAWRVFAAGVLTWAAGHALVAFAPVGSFPHLLGQGTLCLFPLLTAVGLSIFLRHAFGRIPVGRVLLDGVILSASLLLLYTTLLFTPWDPPRGGYPAGTGFDVALVLGDLAVTTLIIFVLTRVGFRNHTVSLLALGLAALIVGDLAAVHEVGAGDQAAGWAADIAHLCAFALAGAAATVPDPPAGAPAHRHRPTQVGLALPYVPFVLAMAASLTPAGAPLTHRTMAGGLAALVVLRQFLTLRDNDHLLHRIQQQVGELDRRAEALAGSNVRLQEHDRLKNEFITLLSHELRTPLTTILGRVEELAESTPADAAPRTRRNIDAISRNSHRLSGLVSDLLSASGLGGVDLQRNGAAVDVAALVAEAAAAVRRRAPGRADIALTAPDRPVPAVGNRDELAKALEELLWNATKFSPPGGAVAVDVATGGGRAVVTITNSGPGVLPQEQERLFTPFFRAATATAQAVQGRGLGLVISRGIVERHGGQLHLTSVPDRETTARVDLPLAPDAPPAAEVPRAADSGPRVTA
ncbi:sensor histidine kinase [Pilimelia terevasa]|nr:HAMP domain-containing sensor histidine kinase [Pilimelia terevasa]